MHRSIDEKLSVELLSVVGTCYATGDFEPLFPYLSDDCVWESQWRLTPETGKEEVMAYFRKKGSILQETKGFPKWMLVKFIGTINTVRAKNMRDQSPDRETIKVGLMYPEGEIALFMAQKIDEGTAASILRITIDDDNLIKRIDICMPELFKFEKYEPENN